MLYERLDLRAGFRRAIDLLGTERLLLGTDSSFSHAAGRDGILDQQPLCFYELGLDKQQAQQILLKPRSLDKRRSVVASRPASGPAPIIY